MLCWSMDITDKSSNYKFKSRQQILRMIIQYSSRNILRLRGCISSISCMAFIGDDLIVPVITRGGHPRCVSIFDMGSDGAPIKCLNMFDLLLKWCLLVYEGFILPLACAMWVLHVIRRSSTFSNCTWLAQAFCFGDSVIWVLTCKHQSFPHTGSWSAACCILHVAVLVCCSQHESMRSSS